MPTTSTPTLKDLFQSSTDSELDILNLKLSELAIRNEINTPIHHTISKVLSRNRHLWAENVILKRWLKEVQSIVCKRKERKSGKRNVLKGKTVINTLEVLEELKKCEAQLNLKKIRQRLGTRKKEPTAVSDSESNSEEEEEDPEI